MSSTDSKYESVVRVLTACSNGAEAPRVSASIEHDGTWTIRITGQRVEYKGASLGEACDDVLRSLDSVARARSAELVRMAGWLDGAYLQRP